MSSSHYTRSEGATFGSLAASCLVLFAIGGWFHNWSHNERGLWWAWQYKTNVLAGLADVWYFFAWGFLATAVIAAVLVWKRTPRILDPKSMFVGGLWVSAYAGVLEEIIFRWLIVLSAPVGLSLLNLVTFGLNKWIHVHWLLPFANWATFGILEPQLTDSNWVMAAAILYAAAAFRNGHAYLGFFGYVNSWFIGMIMFYVMFHYGIITAIVAHILYDVIVFSVIAVSAAFRPKAIFADVLGGIFGR